MWKAISEWFAALVVTASFAVAALGAAEWLEQRAAVVEATADEYTIVVDAGHGGFDGGAVGTDTGVCEAGLNLAVAKMVAEQLSGSGMRVRMTREGDGALAETKQRDMAERRRLLREPEVDLVVSIHMNQFSDRSISGAMAYYMAGSAEGQKLAQSVIDAVCDAIGRARRLANPGDYFVIRECACPAVLVECGFLSNPDDELLLTDPQHQLLLANGIVKGILAYLNVS